MIYMQLLKTEIDETYLKLSFKETFQKTNGAQNTIAAFEEHLGVFESQVLGFIEGSTLNLERDFLLTKRRIFEYKAWIDLFVAQVLEIQPSLYRSLQLENRKLAIFDRLDALLEKLTPLERGVLEIRQERLLKSLDTEIATALEKMQELLKGSLQLATTEEERAQISHLLHNQNQIFKDLAALFNSQKKIWEMLVIRNGRGFIFSDVKRMPFSALYTEEGNIYIVLEVMGHLLGYGNAKIACRAAHLQTGEIYALIRSRIEYPDIHEKQALKNEIEKNFLLTWQESEILLQLHGKLGVLQIRERMAFNLPHGKEVYLIEDYFMDGTLHKHFTDLIEHKRLPFSFNEKFQIGFQILNGLEELHQKGFIHFDIKSENILVDFCSYPKYHVSIADFNMAKSYREGMNYSAIGHTAIWCPPEYAIYVLDKDVRLIPSGKLMFKWDVWGMGCVLYCLYFEEWLPWQAFEEGEIYKTISQLKLDWIPLKHHSHPYYPLIRKMLESDPARRPSSGAALKEYTTLSKSASKTLGSV